MDLFSSCLNYDEELIGWEMRLVIHCMYHQREPSSSIKFSEKKSLFRVVTTMPLCAQFGSQAISNTFVKSKIGLSAVLTCRWTSWLFFLLVPLLQWNSFSLGDVWIYLILACLFLPGICLLTCFLWGITSVSNWVCVPHSPKLQTAIQSCPWDTISKVTQENKSKNHWL